MSTFTLVSLVVWVVFGVVNIRLARKDGRSKLVWFVLTAPFGLLATVFLLIAKAPEPGPARWDSPGSLRPAFAVPRAFLVLSGLALLAADGLSGSRATSWLAIAGVALAVFVTLTVFAVRAVRRERPDVDPATPSRG